MGDQVRVYLGPDDPDQTFHGHECVVIDVFEDELSAETERELDRFSYPLRDRNSGDVLPVEFRHHDLIPDS